MKKQIEITTSPTFTQNQISPEELQKIKGGQDESIVTEEDIIT